MRSILCNNKEAEAHMLCHASLQEKNYFVLYLLPMILCCFLVFMLMLSIQLVIGITITKLPHTPTLQQ